MHGAVAGFSLSVKSTNKDLVSWVSNRSCSSGTVYNPDYLWGWMYLIGGCSSQSRLWAEGGLKVEGENLVW